MVDVQALEDVQEAAPEIALRITKVGVKGVRGKVTIYTPEGELQFDVVIDAYIDLPVSKRGIHMSRNIEAFVEAVEEAKREKHALLEEILLSSCRKLLRKHPYATRAEMTAKTIYYYEESFPAPAPQAADVVIKVVLGKDGGDRRSVSVSIPGITVCPCAQSTYHKMEKTRLPHTPSHTQRVILTVGVTTEGRFVRIEQLIDAARGAFSAQTASLLKKSHEYLLIRRAFERPRFIEDVVRYALQSVYQVLVKDKYPKNTILHVEAESQESVHPHNVYASRVATLQELIWENR